MQRVARVLWLTATSRVLINGAPGETEALSPRFARLGIRPRKGLDRAVFDLFITLLAPPNSLEVSTGRRVPAHGGAADPLNICSTVWHPAQHGGRWPRPSSEARRAGRRHRLGRLARRPRPQGDEAARALVHYIAQGHPLDLQTRSANAISWIEHGQRVMPVRLDDSPEFWRIRDELRLSLSARQHGRRAPQAQPSARGTGGVGRRVRGGARGSLLIVADDDEGPAGGRGRPGEPPLDRRQGPATPPGRPPPVACPARARSGIRRSLGPPATSYAVHHRVRGC